jgi:enoyl-CoA hydratase / 3-hydroxyacyl-CoA dehydrogenase
MGAIMSNNLSSPIAIVGAGNMGSGIAQKYATHGYEVIVVDQSDPSLKKSQASIQKLLYQAVDRNIISEAESKKIFARLRFSKDLPDCHKASLVIEAIFEDLPLKQELFRSLEDIVDKNALLATNTSSFTVTALQSLLKNPQRVLGLHYFYPPAKNRLVELIGSPLTHQGVLQEAEQIQKSINKVIIYSKDSPGFVINRFFVPWLNESMRMVEEKIANIATIEKAAKDFFKIGIGPFQLMNITGLPITFHSCLSLAKSFGDFYAPCPYIRHKIDQEENFDLTGEVDETKCETISMRLLAVVIAISCQIVYEEKICTLSDANLGARVGLSWPKGPFELLDEYRGQAHQLLNIMHGIKMPTISDAVKRQILEPSYE